ncbi:hypothetical protein POSPLADRAFT_1181163 [Postia placenta MAD-698-R-SB12]|uniref:Spindle assembly checkpoint component MAD1 n=1 Tax=Postia placenta MAD-698-R-SB12 TaxID=670580 RepID=A0A1X6N3D8_9APHY|nr:hypothetical protein POSPLADRAFT_1181163 [Postia placenta MAD-698-R-SB12]OSX63139.1 hypothetical protein POSPLADRAFT_1181163 [Postia placenta MAD-698-R-SB12]
MLHDWHLLFLGRGRQQNVTRWQRNWSVTPSYPHASLERQLVAAQTAKADLETNLREKNAQIARLEEDRRWLAEREQEERLEKERERTEHAEDKHKADHDIRSLRASLMTLQEQLADLNDEHGQLSRSTSQTISTQKSQITMLSRQLARVEEQLTEYRRVAEERGRALEELQTQLDDASTAKDSFVQKASDDENWAIVRDELHRQAEHMRLVEAANTKMSAELTMLRERHASVEVLKEQKRELQRRAAGADELREKVIRLEAELEASRREREQWWINHAQCPCSTPVSVTQGLSKLRLEHARLLEEHGSARALLKRREHELTDAERRNAEALEALEKFQSEVRVLKTKNSRVEHDKSLAEREISFLRAMVASFTAEEASQNGVALEEATAARVQQLEALLVDYKATVEQLEGELEEIGIDPHLAGGANSKHLEQVDTLEQTLWELRGEIGAGHHVPPGVRVLSLRNNPAQQWADLSQAAMDRLRGENEALLRRLKVLEESGARGAEQDAHAEELVPRQSYDVVNKEKQHLEDELKKKEKRLLRLQQIFHAKSAEFREAIASILGVKLAFYPNGQVRVTSQFDLHATFVFQPANAGASEGGGMKMQLTAQGEEVPEEVPQLMRYWVEQEQCIPGFMASITLECYEKNKMEREREARGLLH